MTSLVINENILQGTTRKNSEEREVMRAMRKDSISVKRVNDYKRKTGVNKLDIAKIEILSG